MMRKLWLLLLILLVSGCKTLPESTVNTGIKSKPVVKPVVNRNLKKQPPKIPSRYVQKNDGAPKGPLPTRFQKVKPVKEALSRYGNPSSYYANGRSYSVMRSSIGYKARGTASWYGTKFHKQRTSSGDPYDMYAMTAAHRTLPLPSYVRVKNLSNGRTAIVKVNDRGPFHGNRVIDLSYAAAAKLGLMPKGTAPVEIEVLKGAHTKSNYYLQAGAFGSEHLAKRLQEKLISLTPSPVFVERYNGQYIVRVGPFANSKMTDTLKMKLAAKGIYGTFSVLG